MLLYDSPSSGNCYKVRLLLAQLGVKYERVEVDTHDAASRWAQLAGKNPVLRVPVLRFDDGRHLAESNAILWHLAQGTDYLPGDAFEQAKVLQWLFFEQYSHEPYVAVLRHRTLVGTLDELPDLDDRRRRGHEALAALEEELGRRNFLTGETSSIADIALYAYTHVADEGGFDLGRYPAVRAWFDRVAAQPGHVAIVD